MYDRASVNSYDLPYICCARGHKIRQREWDKQSQCMNGICPSPKTCPIANRAEVLQKEKQ